MARVNSVQKVQKVPEVDFFLDEATSFKLLFPPALTQKERVQNQL